MSIVALADDGKSVAFGPLQRPDTHGITGRP